MADSQIQSGQPTAQFTVSSTFFTMVYFTKSLLVLVAVSLFVTSYGFKLAAMDYEPATPNLDDITLKKEYIQYLDSLIEAYRGDQNIFADDSFDTKYRTLKRNGDFINSLLALPKGMSDAGR